MTSTVVAAETPEGWPWHPGEREAQRRAGLLEASPGGGIRTAMPDQHRVFFHQLPFAIVAGVDRDPVATIWTGPPGFITSPDPRRLELAVALDPLDPASPAFTTGAPIALLGIELPTRRRNRANGVIAAAAPDRLAIAVRQSFGNCPRYIHPRALERVAAPPAPASHLGALDPDARAQLRAADTFFIATAARLGEPTGGVDVSHRGGPAGFLRVAGDTVAIPDYPGNRYFNTLGNLVAQPRAALIFPDLATGDVLHLQGTVEIQWDVHELPGAERQWQLHVDHAWRRRGALGVRLA